mgnify:CR=1 FL=1
MPSHRQLGALLLSLERPQEAAAHWLRIAQLEPDNADAFYHLGQIFRYDLKEVQMALGFWQRAVALEPSYVTAHFNMELTYLHQLGNSGRARAHLYKVLDLRPHHPQAEQIKGYLEGS